MRRPNSRRLRLCFATAWVSLAVGSTLADAQSLGGGELRCSPRELMIERLNVRYGEYLRGAGAHGVGGVIELYVSAHGGWTLLLTRPDGQSCPVAVGENWRDAHRRPAQEPKEEPI